MTAGKGASTSPPLPEAKPEAKPTSYTEPGRQAPPKVFRSNNRHYGRRDLRWNRPPNEAAGGAVV